MQGKQMALGRLCLGIAIRFNHFQVINRKTVDIHKQFMNQDASAAS